MERAKNMLNASFLWRWLMALCGWCGEQWRGSAIVRWFLHPAGWGPELSEGSVFYKLWSNLRGALCRLYELLHLEGLFKGSVFTNTWFWCLMPTALAPLMPTMAVLGLAEREAAVLYGQYTFSSTLFNLPAAFLPAVAVSLIPAVSVAVARMDHREVNRVVTTSFRLIAMLAIPAGVGLSVLAGPILLLLYPARRETAIAATYHLQLLGFASIFVCVMLLTNSIMQAHGKVRLPIYTMLIGGAVKVGINYVLVGNPDVNIKGAPLGTLACYALIAVINLAIVHQLLEKKPNYLGIFAKPVLASAVMGAAAWAVHGLLSRVIAGGYLKESLCTFLTVCVAVAVYLILVIALRMVTREDLKMIPKGDKLARLLHIR